MGMIQLNLNSLTELTHRFLAGMLDSKEVAELGIRAVLVGKPLVIPGFINRLQSQAW